MKINIKKIGIIFTILFNIILLNSVSFASVSANNLPKYVVTEDEKFNKIFREGRDLIDKEEWKKAAEKFKEIACDCPENKQVDAALYWLAFCYKKLKIQKEMNETLDRLLRNYPSSSWADDARVMRYEGRIAFATSVQSIGGQNYPSAEILATNIYTTTSQTPLEREDEIKLAAFQSLFTANPTRAIELLGDMIRTGSKSSETLKRHIIRSLRTPRFFTAIPTSGQSIYEAKPDKQFVPQLREALVKGYQNESSVQVRTEIIYTLAGLNDDQAHTYISQLYSSEQNKELKKAIIKTFGGLHYFPSAYATATRQTHSKKGSFDKLLEIIRIEKDSELRRLALSHLKNFSGWSAKEGVIETLIQMYDSENDEELKISIIRTFASTKENQAAMKLLSIAKTDKSDKLRLEAIRSLNNSDNPEVQKFLEDLIN